MKLGPYTGFGTPISARLRYLAIGRLRSESEEMYSLLAGVLAVNYPSISVEEDREIRRRLWEAGW